MRKTYAFDMLIGSSSLRVYELCHLAMPAIRIETFNCSQIMLISRKKLFKQIWRN